MKNEGGWTTLRDVNGYASKCYRSCNNYRSKFNNNDLKMRFNCQMLNYHRYHTMRRWNQKWLSGVKT